MGYSKPLPKPRTKYYVGEPVVVIPLAKLERLADHLTSIALLDRKSINEQAGIKLRHSKLLREMREDLKAAKAYYHITATKKAQTGNAEILPK